MVVKDTTGRNWWQAKNTQTGETGLVASTYVRARQSAPTPDPDSQAPRLVIPLLSHDCLFVIKCFILLFD
jgi:hypothetical protein